MHASGEYWAPQLRAQVVAAVKQGATMQQVSSLMQIPYSTVKEWVKLAKCGFSLDDLPKSGRPRAIDDSTLERICAAVDAEPFCPTQRSFAVFTWAAQQRLSTVLSQPTIPPIHGRSRVSIMPTTPKKISCSTSNGARRFEDPSVFAPL